MARRVPQKRSGLVRVFDTAEMSANFPKSRKLVKQYKFTVYADGRITKSEIKNSAKKTHARKSASKRKTSTAAKKSAIRKGRKQFYEIIWVVGVIFIAPFAYYACAALITVGTGAIVANELMKSAANVGVSTKETTANLKGISKNLVVIVAISGGIYLLSKYVKAR